jgi:hypothetical protein
VVVRVVRLVRLVRVVVPPDFKRILKNTFSCNLMIHEARHPI